MAVTRCIWRTADEVPEGVRALGVKIAVPRMVVEWPDGDQVPALMHSTLVFVELSEAEWQAIGGDVAKANAKAKELGPWLAAQFGGYVKCWHD